MNVLHGKFIASIKASMRKFILIDRLSAITKDAVHTVPNHIS